MPRVVTALAVAVLSLLAASCDWAQPRFGPARAGYNPFVSAVGVDDVNRLRALWSTPLAGPGTDPIVAGGKVFVAVSGRDGGPGYVHAIDAATGAPEWRLTFAGAGCRPGICVSPGLSIAAYDGRLFVARVLTTAGELSAYDIESGAFIRSYSGASTFGPVVADGKLFASYYNGEFGIVAWDLSNDSPVFGTRETGFGFPALAVGGGRVHEVREGQLKVFDAAGVANCTGSPKVCTPLWTATAFGSPAVAGGMVHVGTTVFDASGCGEPTCTPLWTAAVGGPPGSVGHSSPAVAADVLYLGSSDGRLYAFDASGCGAPTCPPQWTATTGGVVGSPAVANGIVYAGSSDGKLHAFDASGCGIATCSPLWTATLGASVSGSPALSTSGRVFVATSDSALRAYGLPDQD
jgi:outer membrane protein assembly factor BamB